MITWHVETSDGSRFEYADDEEEMRRQMIEYYNDTCRYHDQDEELPEDATFDEARDAIEEYENFSYEEVHESCLPKVFVAVIDTNDGGTQTSVHLSFRKAIEWTATETGVDLEHIAHLSDEDAIQKIADSQEDCDWVIVHEEEIKP